ncbi:MAG: hypothetical protein CMJ83_11425 [Planctomycetes bacterium]|nr:hypothetical protein [Planctomycetota bacterium]
MPRLPIVLLIAAVAIALGVVAARTIVPDVVDGGPLGRRYGRAQPTNTGRTPAFHLFLAPEKRPSVARECLDGITSAQAAQLGTLKDDLALLAIYPVVHRMIVKDYEERIQVSRYEAMGFGDLFTRIKHADFPARVQRLFGHEEFSVRRKAMEAAQTQADPTLTPHLDRLFVEITSAKPGQGLKTLELILYAGQACGGDHLPVLVARALDSKDSPMRAIASAIAREKELTGLGPRLRPLLDDEFPSVRVQAAWTLAKFGDPTARQRLAGMLDPKDKGLAVLALDAVRDCGMKDCVPILEGYLPDADEDLRTPMLLTMLVIGDRKTEDRLRSDANSERAPMVDGVIGLMGLAALGRPGDVATLRRLAVEGTPNEASNISAGMDFCEAAPDQELARALIKGGLIVHPGMMGSWLPRIGDPIVPFLADQLDETDVVNRATFLIACLGLVGTDHAREAILDRHERWPNLVEQQVRLLDLDRIKRGVAR